MAELNAPAVLARGFAIDEEFAHLCPRLADDERRLLAESIAAHGVREPLVVWREEKLLLDGHTRLAICTERGVPFETVEYSFADRDAARDWVIENALARRNLSREQRDYLLGKRFAAERRSAAGRPEKWAQSEPISEPGRTAERIARKAGVSRETVKRAAKFAAAVDEIGATAGPEAKQAILDGTAKAPRESVRAAAARKPKSLAEFKRLVGGKTPASRAAPAADDGRDRLEQFTALAARTSAAMRAYVKSGARGRDRERLTPVWELRSEIERLSTYLEGEKS
jgi:ParB-like chromosome segregation protein Spo0J